MHSKKLNKFFIFFFLFLVCQADAQEMGAFLPFDSVVKSQQIEVTRAIVSSMSHESFQGRNMRDGSIELTKNFIENFLKKHQIKPLIGGIYRNKFKFDQDFLAENIVGVIDNLKPKNEYVVLCANYDHLGIADNFEGTNDYIYNGANDNATGCAALMQMAQFLARFKFTKKVLIVFFAGKHEGNYGAGYFADFAKRNNVNIKAVINFEMLGRPYQDQKGKVYMNDNELSNLSFEINYALREKFIVEKMEAHEDDIFEVEPKQDHIPFYNLYGIPANTISTFDPHTDSIYMTTKDDEKSIDFINLHQIINKMTYAVYHILYHNTEIKTEAKKEEE
jgi:hypothetical protein